MVNWSVNKCNFQFEASILEKEINIKRELTVYEDMFIILFEGSAQPPK